MEFKNKMKGLDDYIKRKSFKPNWKDLSEIKYFICYNALTDTFYIESTRSKNFASKVGYYRCRMLAEDVITMFKEELKEMYLG